jgi:hypothetical protein
MRPNLNSTLWTWSTRNSRNLKKIYINLASSPCSSERWLRLIRCSSGQLRLQLRCRWGSARGLYKRTWMRIVNLSKVLKRGKVALLLEVIKINSCFLSSLVQMEMTEIQQSNWSFHTKKIFYSTSRTIIKSQTTSMLESKQSASYNSHR